MRTGKYKVDFQCWRYLKIKQTFIFAFVKFSDIQERFDEKQEATVFDKNLNLKTFYEKWQRCFTISFSEKILENKTSDYHFIDSTVSVGVLKFPTGCL